LPALDFGVGKEVRVEKEKETEKDSEKEVCVRKGVLGK
jgi:hypothetical protein